MAKTLNFDDPFAMNHSIDKMFENDQTKMVAGIAGKMIERGVSDLYSLPWLTLLVLAETRDGSE